MARASIILRNVAANWLGFAVNAGVTLIMTPFVLHHLGPARYGVWVLTASVIGYYGMLDLGLRAGVTQFLTRYLAVGDLATASECMSSALSALTVVSVAVVALSVAMAYAAPHIFRLPPAIRPEAFWCILIVGCASALQFLLFPYAAVFTATERFDLANAIGVLTRLLSAAAIYIALHDGFKLIGISAATCGASAIDYMIRWRVARRIAPELKIAPGLVSRARLREIAAFGFWNFPISAASYAELHAETLIIGLIMPIAAAGYYALATGLVLQIGAMLAPVGQVMYPTAAALHAREDHGGLEQLYRDGTKLMLLATVVIVLIAALWAGDFYRLWLGPRYVSGDTFPSEAVLLRILLIGTVAGYASNIAGQILLGSGRVRLLATALICRTALNIALVLVLIHPFGLLGVAATSAITSILINLLVIPAALRKVARFPVKAVLLRAVARPLAVACLLGPLLILIRAVGPARNWPALIGQGALAGLAALTTVLIAGLTACERDRFVLRPLRRLLKVAEAELR